ncbi:MAG: winged helix-turn-helix transcriptional regulator [Promethearchaeota archaeon]
MWKDLIQLYPQLQKVIVGGLHMHDSEQKSHAIIDIEEMVMHDIFQLVQKKWMIQIVNAIVVLQNPYFNDLKNYLKEISSKTLSIRLKELEKLQIISRHVIDAQPIRVLYTYTEFGMGLFTTLMPFILFFVNPKPFMQQIPKN